MNFFRISRQIPEKSDVCRFFNRICENKWENCRKFWDQILWKLFIIIHDYSSASLARRRGLEGAAARLEALPRRRRRGREVHAAERHERVERRLEALLKKPI